MILTTKTEKIQEIIHQRLPLAEKIAQVETNLKQLRAKLQILGAKTKEETISSYLQEIDLLTPQNKLEQEIAILSRLKTRFGRKTLNLGVVGRAGQGKSKLLQSLSGLTSAEIPTGDRQHCTGVRSTIYHNPNLETYAEIWFHSETAFLTEVIHPYYEKLHLGLKPSNLEAFGKQPLAPLGEELSKNAVSGAMYEHLRNYHTNLDKYRHLFAEASPYRLSQDQIRAYIAQDTVDGQRNYYNYLAAREAKIVCSFPNQDLGQIALVDMPGLGDTGLGDPERLIQVLGQDVDLVLFIRMPRPPRDYWADVDVQLYDIASQALRDLPLEKWSFLILNRTNSDSPIKDNSIYCQDLASTHLDKHLYFVDCLIANCGNSIEANQKILDPILDYLTENITSLDQQYAQACQERIWEIHHSINAELTKAQQSLKLISMPSNWFSLFEQLFEQLWDELTTSLEDLLEKFREQRDWEDFDFKEQVEAAIKACQTDTGIPTIVEVETRRKRLGGYPNAYYEYLNEIRAHLSQHFLLLDRGLKKGLERVKSEVAAVLIQQGRLGNLTTATGSEFLSTIVEQIPPELDSLRFGFQTLAEFNLAYRGMIQHRIRVHLDDLTPNSTTLQLSTHPNAEEVLICLRSLQAEAVYKCQTALDDLLAEPSQAAFAIVEEFLDRVLRAEGVKSQWRIFLEEIRGEIWSSEFAQLGTQTRTRREWLDLVKQVSDANHIDQLRFLDGKT
ncbi:hypothetical protein [Gloeocapsa sp. PCC 73106]|uniref:hypothetical protein n=1 Tax=Gloeocapsa sp. PCC 73106 TaxID=102232 RepID=UPI0002AD1604|nr:hypothetical protein [Gloeocapsa sp. PCC 73106]ELR96438.1 hypothetical protein GLO73106DRAFT_00002320 [Gloeocapsa sp. PCC 73106]